jgi:hypothetical protein
LRVLPLAVFKLETAQPRKKFCEQKGCANKTGGVWKRGGIGNERTHDPPILAFMQYF